MLREAVSGLQRTVAPPDHQDVEPRVLGRIDQPVDDLRLLLTGHPELARRAAAPDGEHDGARRVAAARRRDAESLALTLDRIDDRPWEARRAP